MTVIIPKDVYYTVVAASVRYANARIPDDDWLEVSGVFIGKADGNNVIINKAYPIMHQELDKDAVIDQYKWSDEDYEALYIIDDEAFSKGEFTVGWWHSHPGFKVMMSHIDIRTTLSYQTNNPNAISLVFNPIRLIRQVELPNKKGDPIKQLKNDPGFKIFRLDDVNSGIQASYHEVDFEIQGFDSIEQLVSKTQKFIIDITNFFPKDNLYETYDRFIKNKINDFNSKIMGTEEYLKTLQRKGERDRIPEVLENQKKDIRQFVAETFIEIENIKEFMNYLEFKERQKIIPKVQEILSQWDENVSNFNDKLEEISKKF
ncbi:MAG: hypothetical protein P8Y97_04860 [Candidatus Lokiarchaeota archaeon]